MKTTTHKKFIIEGSHRNRQSFVFHLTEPCPHGLSGTKLLFVIEREQDEVLGRPTGFSYFGKSLTNHSSFIAESWGEVIEKLNEIL